MSGGVSLLFHSGKEKDDGERQDFIAPDGSHDLSYDNGYHYSHQYQASQRNMPKMIYG